jgi:preprotein translocase subunit YajC
MPVLFTALEPVATQPQGQGWITIAMLVIVFAVFYFVGIRPQKKQEREQNEMRNSLCIGDEITTIGGILGRVVKITEETVVIETSRERTKLHILKTAIRSVDVRAEDTVEAAEKAAKKAEQEKSDK